MLICFAVKILKDFYCHTLKFLCLKSTLPSSVISCPKAKILTVILTLLKNSVCCCLWFVCVAVLRGWVQMSVDPCACLQHIRSPDQQDDGLSSWGAQGFGKLCSVASNTSTIHCPRTSAHINEASAFTHSSLKLGSFLTWGGDRVRGKLFTVFKFCLFLLYCSLSLWFISSLGLQRRKYFSCHFLLRALLSSFMSPQIELPLWSQMALFP